MAMIKVLSGGLFDFASYAFLAPEIMEVTVAATGERQRGGTGPWHITDVGTRKVSNPNAGDFFFCRGRGVNVGPY